MDHTIFVDELTEDDEQEDQEDKNVTNFRLQERNTTKVSKKDKEKEKLNTLRQRVEHDIVDKDYKKLLTKKFMVKKFPFIEDAPEMTFLHFAIEKQATKTVEFVMKLFNSYVKKHKPVDINGYRENTLYDKIINEVGRRKILNYIAEKMKLIMKMNDNDNEDGEEKVKVDENTPAVNTNDDKNTKDKIQKDRLTEIKDKYAKQLENADKFMDIVFPILTSSITNKYNWSRLQIFIEEIKPTNNDSDIECNCLLLELTFDKILTSNRLSKEQIITLLSNVTFYYGESVFHRIAFFLKNVDHSDEAACEISYNIIENIWKKCAAIVDPYKIEDDCFYFCLFSKYCDNELPNYVRRLLPPHFIPEDELELRNENVYETQIKYLSKKSDNKKNFLQFVCVEVCIRKMSDKIHPEVFNKLLCEKYNRSNCLDLIVSDSFDIGNNNCNCENNKGKTIKECNIEFIMNHLKECNLTNCSLLLSESKVDTQKFINYIYQDDGDVLKILRQRVEEDVVDKEVKKILTEEFIVQELPFIVGYRNMRFLEFVCLKKATKTVEFVMKVLNSYVLKHKPVDRNDYKDDSLYDKIIWFVGGMVVSVARKMKEIVEESNKENVVVDDNEINTNKQKIQQIPNENINDEINIEDKVREIKYLYDKQLKTADEYLDVVFPILTCPFTHKDKFNMLQVFIYQLKPDSNTDYIKRCLLLELTIDKMVTSPGLSTEQVNIILSNVATYGYGYSVFHRIAFFLENVNHSDEAACEISYNIIENIWNKCAAIVDPYKIEDDCFYFHTFSKYCDNELPNYVRRLLPLHFIPEDASKLCNENVYETQIKYLSKKSDNKKNFLQFVCVEGCFRKMSDKIHPEVLNKLLHEKYNGSNCLDLIVSDSGGIGNYNCNCGNDKGKTITECNIEFVNNHLKGCTLNNCSLLLSESKVDTQKFINYIYQDDGNVLKILRQRVEEDVVDEDVEKILTVEFIVQKLPFMSGYRNISFLSFACRKKATKTVEFVMTVLNSYVLKHKPVDVNDYKDDSLYHKIIQVVGGTVFYYVADEMKKIVDESNEENVVVDDNEINTNKQKIQQILNENINDEINIEDKVRKIKSLYDKQLKTADEFLDVVFPILTCTFTHKDKRNMLRLFIYQMKPDGNTEVIKRCLLLELTIDKMVTSRSLSKEQIITLLSNVDSEGDSVFFPIAFFLENVNNSDEAAREISYNIIENIWKICAAVVDPYKIEDDCFYFDTFGWYCNNELPNYVRRLLPLNFLPEDESKLCNENVYETQIKYLSKKSDSKKNFLHRYCNGLCLKNINIKLHPKVFNTLLHEKHNGSNCLHLIVEAESFTELCNCEKDTDKTVLDCDIEFIMEHLENCTSNKCLSLSELNPDGKMFFQLLNTEILVDSINRLRKSTLSIGQLLALLDNTSLVDKKEANNYIENKFKSTWGKINRNIKSMQFESGLDKKEKNYNEKSKSRYEQTIQACINAFRLQNTSLTKHLLSSTYVECFGDKDKNTDSAVELAKKLSEKNITNNNEMFENIIHNKDKFQELTDLNLLYIALVAERYKMCELLLITEQIDVIPDCLRVMLFCQYKKMIGNGKQNSDIDRLQDFCQTVLHNALGELFRSVTEEEEDMLFQYICGTMKYNDKTTNTLEIGGPLFKPFLIDTEQDKTQKSILQMVEDVNILAEMDSYGTDDDTKFRRIFTSSSFIKLQQWLWNKYNRNSKSDNESAVSKSDNESAGSKSDNENIYGQKIHFTMKILFDFLFLSIYTIYLLTGIYDNTPFQKPWSNFTQYWKHEQNEDVWYYHQLFHLFQSNFSVFLELSLVIYWIGIIIEEVKEVNWIVSTCGGLHPNLYKRRLLRLWLNLWNLTDLFYIVMFGLFVGMRIAFYITRNQNDIYISRYAPLRTHFISMFWTRIIAGLAYLAICFRRMYSICMMFKSMGVLYITFQQLIIKDLFPFLTMLAINILSFGVFFQVLLNPGSLSFFPNGTIDQHKLISLLDVYARPMMVAFGEYGLDDIGKCFSLDTLGDRARRGFPTIEFREVDECTHPAGTFLLYAYLAIFIFMLTVNLTLFNLLIARFSLTVTRYTEEAVSMYYWYLYLEWKQLDRSRKVDTTPVNILYVFIDCIITCRTCCQCNNKIQDSSEKQRTFKESDEYLKFLVFQANAFSDKRVTFTNPIYETAKQVDSAVLKLQTSINKQFDDMEISINKKLEKEIDLITNKLNSIEQRFDKLESLNNLEKRFDKLESLNNLEKRFDKLENLIIDHLK